MELDNARYIAHGAEGNSAEWLGGDHRADGARPFGFRRRVAALGLAARACRTQRHLAFHRAHGVQGHRPAHGRGHRARSGPPRRNAGRVHRQGNGLLQHARARRASAESLRHGRRYRPRSEICRRRYRPRAIRDPRGNPHDPGQSRGPGPRAFHAEFLERRMRSASRFWERPKRFRRSRARRCKNGSANATRRITW